MTKHRPYLSGFKIVRPKYETSQIDGVAWLAGAHALAKLQADGVPLELEQLEKISAQMQKVLLRYGAGPDKIKTRGHELKDFTHRNWEDMAIFNLRECSSGRGMESRMRFFADAARAHMTRFYDEHDEAPSNLIHVTCTGYTSPSAAQSIVESKNWFSKTKVTHAYHMGCYASIPALRLARGFVAAEARHESFSVDVAHTELCTLHMNPALHSPDQLVVQSLFADGAIKYSVRPFKGTASAFEICALHEEIVPNTQDAMTWMCSDWGMQMTLSRDVPGLIGKALNSFLERLFSDADMSYSNDKAKCLFAIHPGGPKIIEQVQETLELRHNQIEQSVSVLSRYGNMSSATLPHVWELICGDSQIEKDTPVVSLAFGPGLTICGSIFRKV